MLIDYESLTIADVLLFPLLFSLLNSSFANEKAVSIRFSFYATVVAQCITSDFFRIINIFTTDLVLQLQLRMTEVQRCLKGKVL